MTPFARALQDCCAGHPPVGVVVPTGMTPVEPTDESLWNEFYFFHHSRPTERKLTILSRGFMMVAQGAKRAYYRARPYTYAAGQFVLLTAPLPLDCHVIEASPERPYLAFYVPLQVDILAGLVEKMGLKVPALGQEPDCLTIHDMSEEWVDAATRLLLTLKDEERRRVVGHTHFEELYFYALRGPHRDLLLHFLARQGKSRTLYEILDHIHHHVDQRFSLSELASRFHTNVSSLHRDIKALTGMAPQQYIKCTRLHKAYTLIHYHKSSVQEAAQQVGYASPSQFSREFKRSFGQSPLEVLRGANSSNRQN